MSLKSFHIFFISVSILFSAGFGVWLLSEQPMMESLNTLGALLSFSVGGGLVLYMIKFLRKFKGLRFF